MGNASSAEEEDHGRLPEPGQLDGAPPTAAAAAPHSTPTTPESGDSSDNEDWDVMSSEAPRQMPSQQYYPMLWTHQLDSHTSEAGRHISPSLSTTARPRESTWRQVGMALAVGAVACLEVVAERQQEREAKEQRQQEMEEARSAVPAPSAPPSSTPPARTAAAAGGAPPSLPDLCYHHPDCCHPGCDRLHLCLLFLADLCRLGDRCRRGHSLATQHNQWVCDTHQLDTRWELECLALLRRAGEQNGRLPLSLYRNNLSICFWSACDGACNKLHICRRWVAGDCIRPVCKFGHDLRSPQNRAVLRRHKMEGEEDAAVWSLLRDKYSALAPKGAAAAGGGEGRSRRPRQQQQQQQQQQTGRGAAVGGLSEELQCAVCLELFARATTLGCGHTFCAGCVLAVGRCPLCRATITSSTRSVALDSIISGLTAKR